LRSAILIAGCCIGIGVVWLTLGSRILLVFDRCFPGPPTAKDADPLLIDADSFGLGSRRWPLPGPAAIKLIPDSQQRVVFRADGRTFTFGPVKTMWDDPVKAQYLFVPEPGDVVSFKRDVSRLHWHIPFAFSIMGGDLPKRHRYAYDRLRWTKNSGAILEITWRDEQGFYAGAGWQDEYNYRLVNISIRPGPVEKTAAAYLAATKRWTGNDYRLEAQAATPEDDLIAAVYLQDEAASHPGAGKSVLLRINKSSKKVVSETAFQ
jgi:hypothetical protein